MPQPLAAELATGSGSSLKILMVSDDFLPAKTGVGNHLQTLSRELVKRGHQVSVVTSRPRGHGAIEMWNGVKIIRLPSLMIADFPQALSTPWALRRILREEQPDIVHYHYLSILAQFSAMAVKKSGAAQFLTYHFSPEVITQPWFLRPLRPYVHWQLQRFYHQMTTIITPSLSVYRQLEKMGLGSRLCHITNPLSLQHTAGTAAPSARKSGFTILYAGRLATEKNLPLLLRAVAKAKAELVTCTLWIAGAGPMRAQLEAMCKTLGITEEVVFLGQLNHQQLAGCYEHCDLFVLPSIMETLSLVAIEAMSFGKPLIVTDRIACAEELVEDGKNGFIVDAEDETACAARIVALAQQPELAAAMGRAALEKSRFYCLDTVMDQLEAAYRNACPQDVSA